MSKQKKKIKFRYRSIPCILCGKPIKLLIEPDFDDLSEEENKEYLRLLRKQKKSYTFDAYLIKTGTMTGMQSGYLCSQCLKKPLEKRIKNI